MKANELRIGNWVKDENGFYQIKGEHLDEDTFPTIQTWGITLTEEWFVKFGFERDDVWVEMIKKISPLRSLGCVDNNIFICQMGQDLPFQEVFLSNCQYVHQIQNLYFAITGEELTIGGQDE